MVLRGSKTKGTTLENFVYGGISGCCSRTMVAPLDRIKILLQTTSAQQNTRQMFVQTLREEGITSLWKGNVLNCSRVLPYSALQFGSYDLCKSYMYSKPLSVYQRLSCGTVAGFVATTLTHPIDVVRHRLLMNQHIHTFRNATLDIFAERGYVSFFKGYGSSVVGLVPFVAVNFCTFDTLKSQLQWTSSVGILSIGAMSALVSQTVCYPLDTIRRRMQLRGHPYRHGLDAFMTLIRQEGFIKLYAGMSANAMKIIPNNSIRFLVYDLCRNTIYLKSDKE